MPTNDFLPIGQSASTILTQSAWNALSQRTAGWAAGILPPEHYNKSLRQSSTIAAMIGEFIKTIGGLDALDDSDNATLLANFIASLDARIGGGNVDVSTFRVVTNGPVTAPPVSPTSNDEVLVGDSPSGAFSGNARKLARWNGTGWSFSVVRPGRIFRVNNTDTYWTLNASTGWQTFVVPIAFVSGLQAALDGKVSKSGDTMTGTLAGTNISLSGTLFSSAAAFTGTVQATVPDSGNAFQINKTGSDRVAALCPVNLGSGRYGLGLWRYTIADGSSGWSAVWDKDGNLALNGGTAPTRMLDVAGTGKFSGLLELGGGIQAGGTLGDAGKVLVGGSVNAWRTLAELGIGKKLIYLASPGGSSITVTFPVAEPDTSYSVIGLTLSDNGSGYLTSSAGVTITGKTVNGFTATGIGTSSINIVFLAAIR